MKDTNNVVSVIIPVYNRSNLVIKAIKSVEYQTYREIELILVDDYSTDGTYEVLCNYEFSIKNTIIHRNSKNLGVSASRNKGIDLSTGELIAFLDSDDLWLPNKLEEQIKALNEKHCYKDKLFLTCKTIVLKQDKCQIKPAYFKQVNERFQDYLLANNNFVQVSSFLVTRRAIKGIRFNEELRQYEDYEFFLKVGEIAEAQYLYSDRPLVIHDDSERPGRLGSKDYLVRGRKFATEISPFCQNENIDIFQYNLFFKQLFKENPFKSILGMTSLLLRGKLSVKRFLINLFRAVISEGSYSTIRKILKG